MGFHIKSAENGKEYNLDLSYEKILKPVLNNLNIEYIRADEIMCAEIIDESMYRFLLCADLVIADITTLNPNALYELGVRYALKPYATIIIGDKNTRFPFDLNHMRIFSYKHEGKTIAEDECMRMQEVLLKTIKNIRGTQMVDSPVYKYIKGLIPPVCPNDESYFKNISTRFRVDDSLCSLVNAAYYKRERGDFLGAIESYKRALKISKDEYIIKEIAICTYQGGKRDDYLSALRFLKENINTHTTNPEILKAFGTIYKHLWISDHTEEMAMLSMSYYQKSFVIYKSYNSGLNYGLMLFAIATYQESSNLRETYILLAKLIYQQVENLCLSIDSLEDYWIIASLEECALALGNMDKYKKYNRMAETAIELHDEKMRWKREKTQEQINILKNLLKELAI